MAKLNNLKVDGRVGTWYEIGRDIQVGKEYIILEHEEYGNDADWIVIEADTKKEVEDEVVVTKALMTVG